MTITFTGLGSGLDYSEWVTALVEAKTESVLTPLKTTYSTLTAKQSTLNKVKTSYSSLLTATQTFTDSKYGTSKDIFASNTVSSTNDKQVAATVTNSTPRQTLSVFVNQLATATKVISANAVASPIDGNTKISTLASGSVKEGTMSFYVGDSKYSIDVTSDDTLQDIADKMETASGSNVEVSISDTGEFTISSKDGSTVRVGSNSDSSSLSSALALKTDESGNVKSAYPISALNLSKPLTSVESGFYTYNEAGEKIPSITEGDFVIGNATIKITSSTTMNELISNINSSADANATAFFDTVENKLVITSKQEGAFNVNIEAGTSNFTDIMGVTKNGNIISDTQILGQNAEITINGSKVQSFSNTITSETSGIPGLTLNLKEVSEENKPVTITIGQDTDKIISEIETLIKAINDVIDKTDSATEKGGDLQYESRLNSLRNSIRTEASGSVQGLDTYKTLASIGITTGDFGTSVDTDTNSFIIDKDKLREALENDSQAVKKLLLGDGEDVKGLVQSIQEITDAALDSQSGYFATRGESLTSEINNVSDKITFQTTRIQTYQEQLEKKFQLMDKNIAALQQQYSQMSSLLSS